MKVEDKINQEWDFNSIVCLKKSPSKIELYQAKKIGVATGEIFQKAFPLGNRRRYVVTKGLKGFGLIFICFIALLITFKILKLAFLGANKLRHYNYKNID